jgi:acyl carrier protein
MWGVIMIEEKFIHLLEGIVMVDEGTLTLATDLSSLDDWDSLAMASLLVELEDQFSLEFDGSLLRKANTIGDLYQFVTEKIQG